MVRETRHLWVGNLPDNIREDRIREHFKRYVLHLYCECCKHNIENNTDKTEGDEEGYGRVQSVKLLPRQSEEKTGEVSMACTVAFMDIKSAAKAHNAELKIDDRTLNTEYYEPAAIPSAASPQGTPPPYSTSPGSTRFPNGHGSSDEHGFPDPAPGSTRFYDRSSSSGGVAPATAAPEGGSGTCRGGRNRDRFRGGGGGGHRGAGVWGTGYESSRYNNSNERSQSETTGYNSTPSDSSDRRNSENVRKKAKSRSGSRSPSPNGSTSSRSPSRSRSRSSSSSSSSSTSRDTASSTSSPSAQRTTTTSSTTTTTTNRRHRRRHSKKSASQCTTSGAAAADDRRPLAICVRNLPGRSSDTSLKDGLFHEYKKHGKVTWVKIVGQSNDRYAIVCFKKAEDAEKALEVSYDKLFFGCKIEVAPYSVCDIDEVEFRYESEIDEYNPKATRTLFIGNLEKDVTASDLRKHFDQFGEIIEIDIKKQGAVSSYAFCQYSDIVSVVKAIRKMDGEHLGNNRIKLGFGKSMAYNCVWIDGVNESVNEKYLRMQFEPFGAINKCILDRDRGQALVFYEHVSQAQLAVNKMRGFVLKNTKLQVDFASRECQECFFERLEKQGTVLDRAVFEERRDSSSRSFESAAPNRISRYDTPTRPRTSSYSSRSSVAAVASPGTPGNATPRGAGRTRVARYYDYELDYGALDGRHVSHRSYDEYSQGSAASHEDPYDSYDHTGYLHDSPGHLDPLEVRVVQTLVEAVPYAPHDIRNLQKERVHLLEQLEECPSSGDELISPKKRLKLDLLDPAITGDVIIEANRDHNRKVMEVRRLSESTLRHHSRRPSVDNKYGHYAPHTVGCKRRRTGGSDGGAKSASHSHYTEHSDGSDHGGSRPGTPLCDENPEFPPGEPPKRTTRDREGPLMLPLPKWAAQVRGTSEFQRGTISVAGIKGQKEPHVNPLASPPPAATSPRVSHHHQRPPSPSHVVPPPASPPPRPPSLSSNSSDSDGASGSPSLEERIKSLDEKYEKWSGSRSLSAAGNDALALLDANREKFRLRHKLLEIQDLKEVQPSEIVKSVMAKRSVFDEDLKRLECVGEKYEPKEFVGSSSSSSFSNNRLTPIVTSPANVTSSTTPVCGVATTTVAPAQALKLSTVAMQSPKTPTLLSPRSSATALPITASRGLQYPFPSHPPMQMSPIPPPSQAPPTPTAPSVTAAVTVITAGAAVAPPLPPMTTTSSSSTSFSTSTSSSVAVRGPNLGENRLKPLANAPGDTTRTSSLKNRSLAVVSEGKVKSSEKIILRRNSSSTSPRADVKTRRNSDTSARRIDDADKCDKDKTKSDDVKIAEKAKEELEKQQKEQEEKEKLEKERIEKEKQEKERLERERKEKERLERESELEKQRLEKERLEKERIQREKEKAEKERLEKEKERERLRLEKEKAAKLEKERLEKERIEKEKLDLERQEKERQEKEKLEKERIQQQEREEKARKERELHEKLEKERKEAAERKEHEERVEKEKEREQKAKEEESHRIAKEKERERKKSEDRSSSRHKDTDNHERSSNKHRENHSETKHKENSHHGEKPHEKSSSTKESREDKSCSREEGVKLSSKDSGGHDTSHKKESNHPENPRLETVRQQIERDSERRKESIKENRENNIHDKHKHIGDTKDHIRDRAIIETRHMSLDLDKNQIIETTKEHSKKKERNNSLPANIGLKRRMSSHEIMESFEEPKKIKFGHEHKKIFERRESKDSSKSDDKSKKSKHKNNMSSSNSHDKHNSNSKESEERRKEREREREERHKKHKLEKQKSKSKSREKDKESRESPAAPDTQPTMSDKDFLAKLNLRSNEDIERERQRREKEGKERRKDSVGDMQKHLEDIKVEDKVKKERHHSFDGKNSLLKSPQEDPMLAEERRLQRKDRIRKMTNSTDSDSDEPKKHSIFDIVDDGPPYISMYDKVKARSCKNMQKQEEEKRQEKIKAKFSQLKQSRARREEKKRSTSWDEDSDSDKEGEIKSRRHRKVLDSSDDSSEHKSHKRKDILYSDSDNSLPLRSIKTEPIETTDDDVKTKHSLFKGSKSRIASDTSEDEYQKTKISSKIVSNDYHEKKVNQMTEQFSENDADVDIDVKPEKLTSVKTELERLVKKERRNSKFQEFSPVEHQTFDVLHTEPSEVKTDNFNSRPMFENTTDDDVSEMKKERAEKREKKHKKKQKKQRYSLTNEDGVKMENNLIKSEEKEKKHHDKKKDHPKKDKKRDKTREGREKSKKSKKNRLEEKGDSKHEGKMENIFGSLSEDSEAGNKDQKPTFLVDENAPPPSPICPSDSEKEIETKGHEERDREIEHKRKKEKKRREKERRLQEAAAEAAAAAAEEPPNSNENSMDFADMGKQLEANIKDDTFDVEFQTEIESSNLETSDTFNFTDQEIKKEKEDRKESKEKKKKRKKSKDEKKHHHHHHHDKNKVKTPEVKAESTEPPPLTVQIPEIKIEPEKDVKAVSPTKPSTPSSASLPSLLDVQSPGTEKPSPDFMVSPSTRSMVPLISPIPKTPTTSKVKRETLIPGFGTEIDETVHENAVKSISTDFESSVKTQEVLVKEEIKQEIIAETVEDKPRVVISQEETEDAVAALLGESFGGSQFEERYTEEIKTTSEEITPELVEENVQDDEEMRKAVQSLEVEGEISKPDTPQSEHELQIDTDTDEPEENTTATTVQTPAAPQVPKTSESQFFSGNANKVATPSPLNYKTLSSPPSLTPIKPQSSSLAEVRKNIDKEQKSPAVLPEKQLAQKSVIAQSWSTDRKESETDASLAIETSSNPPVLKSFSASPAVKVGEPNYPPLAKLTPLESKVQPATTLVQPSLTSVPSPVKTQVQTNAPPIQLSAPVQVPFKPQVSAPFASVPVSSSVQATSKPQIQTSVAASLSVLTSTKSQVQTMTPSLPSISSSPALTKPQVASHIHNLPARSPVQICKPALSEGMLSPKSSGNVSLNRLPITPVMVSKPLQPATVYLPQSKIAHSSEPPKLVSTAEVRPQERPRMIFQTSNMPPYGTFPAGQPPRILVPGNVRHLPPTGLLVPTRHMNPVGYGFMGNIPHSSTYPPLPPKEVQPQPEGALKLVGSSVTNEPISKSTIVMAGSHGAHVPSPPRTPLTCSTVSNPSHLVLTSPKSALSPNKSLGPLKSPNSSQAFVSPSSPRHSPKSIPVIMESPHISVSPSPERKSPAISQTPPPKPCTPEPSHGVPQSEPRVNKEPVHLPVPIEPIRSTPSPVIVPNPEVKSEAVPPPSPVKLAIETVTEELNLSLEKKDDVKEVEKTDDIKEDTDKKEIVKEELKEEVKPTEKTIIKDEVKDEMPEKLDVKVEPPIIKSAAEELSKLESEPCKSEAGKSKQPELVPNILQENPHKPISILPKDDDPLESKEDNDFWSAKDSVNIDSVIKTLGSADEMSDDENKRPLELPITPKTPTKVDDKDPPPSPDKKLSDSVSSEEKHEEDTEINVDSIETDTHHKLEVSVTRSSSRRGRGGRPRGSTKIKISVEREGIQTRRGKLKQVEAQSTTPTKRGRGGKARTERKSSKSESESTPNDVYEFRDDSDDCNKEQRPRLVLTIKSTTSSTSNAQTTAIVKEITKDGTKEIGKEAKEAPLVINKPPKEPVVETKEEFTSPQTNTRKSRRLAQKDTSRNTIDDTIEDVVKNTPLTRSASNQRRSGRQNKKPQPLATDQDTPRKSPRGRKPLRRASEATDNSSSEDTKDDNPKSVELAVPPSPSIPTSPSQPKPTSEVEKDNKQPLNMVDASKEKKPDHCSLKTAMLKRFKGEMGSLKKSEPTNLIDPVTGMLIPMHESEEGKYIPLPGGSPGNKKVVAATCAVSVSEPQQAHTAIEPTKTQASASVIAQPHQITVVQQQVPKVHPLKAHVLSSQAAKAVVSEQPVAVVQAKAQVPPVARETIPLAHAPASSVVISKPSVPVLISRSATQVTHSVNVATTAHPVTVVSSPSPRPGVPVAVTSKSQVKPPLLSPSQQLLLTNQKHLLQAREQLGQMQAAVHMTSSITSHQNQLVNTQIAHAKHRHEQVIMGGAKGTIGTKAAHALHQQHLTGRIASPPASKGQVPGRIIQGLPQAVSKGVMEPPKVDVNLPNMMLGRPNLSPSGPQARLAGLPVPAYEAGLIAEARAYYNRTSPPPAHQNAPHSPKGEPMSHFPPGPLRPPDLNPHYMHPQHMMYQQFLRQQQLQQHFQRSANLEKSGEEGEEAPVGLAVSGRGATVPHHSPHDRATESPAIGQVYNTLPHSARLPPYHPGTRYFDQQPAEPPPAHRPLTSHDRAGLPHIPPLGTPDRPLGAHTAAHLIPDRPSGVIPERPLSAHLVHDRAPLGTPERAQSTYGPERSLVGAGLGAAGNLLGAVAKHVGVDVPAGQRGIQAATPPLASQVPPQAESLFMLLKQYPLMWQGLLALKNDQAAVQMYFVSGNDDVAKCSLPKNTDGSTPPLRIFQRMRLEPMQVEGVARKMQMENEHCMLLALPCGHDHMDVLKQSTNLTNGFITYLQLKQAAGIVNVAAPGTTQPPAYVVHIFPSCDFVNENLRRIAPSLLERVADIAHLLIVITTV